ncbi:MAG: AAA domain-containing protein [Archangium sp.]
MSTDQRLRDFLGTEDHRRSTDDVLAMTLPLLEQVAALHEQNLVAPLEGVEALKVTQSRLWFEAAQAIPPRLAPAALEQIQKPSSLAFEVVSHSKQVDDGDQLTSKNLRVIEPDTKFTEPVHVTRYVSWEHEVAHHDPLTDIYVLGLVLASVALDENLGTTEALEAFVAAERDVSRMNSRLHPVLARTIVSMTEPVRSRRAQDLPGIIFTLKHYREQTITTEPSRDAANSTRSEVYGRLRDRLFDFSRRNRLLHFNPTSQTVNLTIGSVPLVLDIANVSPDALLTWKGKPASDLGSGKATPLGRYLRFEDYPFLSGALDHLRLEANRAKNELGFSPLRLVACFLQWHNLKEDKHTRITSPLLLLPVTLERKKGVRDAVFITADDTEFEVNPVLRQYLHQLYGVRLPETIPLDDDAAIDQLVTDFTGAVQASEPGVTINRVDKPRIDLVLAQAKKRLDAFRKRAALSGRGARSHRGFDYSYARSRLHPLGVQLFTNLVYPSQAAGREMHDQPGPRIFRHSPDVVEKSLYSLNATEDASPLSWTFDFCNVTLANFNSRKTSLVRDYAGLIESAGEHRAFDTLFSKDVRPVGDTPAPLPLDDRYDVMPADPTQASAVARARRGDSFIIQGPPGTGKSQTITNLLADAVASGKRVLFVCEKRAAIDVVFHRLKMQGLAPLTCLIHDSQTDKKAFIKDLKETYESWIAQHPGDERAKTRVAATSALSTTLDRGARFRSAMQRPPRQADQSLQSLMSRVLELHETALHTFAEILPTPRDFALGAAAARNLEEALRALGREPMLGKHPLRLLSNEVLTAADPADLVRTEAKRALGTLESLLNTPALHMAGKPDVRQLSARMRLLQTLRPLIIEKALRLLDAASELRGRFDVAVRELNDLADLTHRALSAASGWSKPLPPEDVATALTRARQFEASFFSRVFGWLSPAWWQLRKVLNASFDFASRAVRPTWTEALEKLNARYAAETAEQQARTSLQKTFAIEQLDAVTNTLQSLPPAGQLEAFQTWLITAPDADTRDALATALAASGFDASLSRVLQNYEALSPEALRDELRGLERGAADLPALLEPLRALAPHDAVSKALRGSPVDVTQLEHAVCRASVDATLKERALDMLLGRDWDTLRDETLATGARLRDANAAAVVERARNRFLENVNRSHAPSEKLDAAQKQFKKQYATGRKELEHEFGKTMRYRAIRDLATGNPGVVVRDLKPVWLMSPLSVADTLPLDASFDLVVFDEASQIPLEDAIPAAHRAGQLIVVGDEMQLPPTDFFGASRDDDEELPTESGVIALDAPSLLTHATRALPSTMLGWHYRSRDEALITFSNRVFYEGRLLTVPSVTRAEERAPIEVKTSADGVTGAAELLARTISFHRLETSPYEQRRNTGEARYIAELVRELINKKTGQTIGVVAFSEAQQREIEGAIDELCADDSEFAAAYEAEVDREEDGQHVGLFVKNLENVQGDERDIIIISVCYAPDPRGKMLMNFGPINKAGGEKRLNVIFSRAKRHLAVISSIRWTAITNEYNDGANCLRNYLRYAEASSVGASAEVALALKAWSSRDTRSSERSSSVLEKSLAAALKKTGHQVDTGVGTSRFRCHLGIKSKRSAKYQLGILLDDDAQQSLPTEEVLQAQASVLKGFDWKTLTVLHRDWYETPDVVLRRIEAALAETT